MSGTKDIWESINETNETILNELEKIATKWNNPKDDIYKLIMEHNTEEKAESINKGIQITKGYDGDKKIKRRHELYGKLLRTLEIAHELKEDFKKDEAKKVKHSFKSLKVALAYLTPFSDLMNELIRIELNEAYELIYEDFKKILDDSNSQKTEVMENKESILQGIERIRGYFVYVQSKNILRIKIKNYDYFLRMEESYTRAIKSVKKSIIINCLEEILSLKIYETSHLILDDYERIADKYNNKISIYYHKDLIKKDLPETIVESSTNNINSLNHTLSKSQKRHENLENLELIQDNFMWIEKRTNNSVEKSVLCCKKDDKLKAIEDYFEGIKKAFEEGNKKLDEANDKLNTDISYLAPFLYFLNTLLQFEEEKEIEQFNFKKERSKAFCKMGEYYTIKATSFTRKLQFKSMPCWIFAKQCFTKAYNFDECNYDAVGGCSKSLCKLGKFNECIEFLKKFKDKENLIPDYHRIYAICLRSLFSKPRFYSNCSRVNRKRQDNIKEAQNEIEKTLNRDPYNPMLRKEAEIIKKITEQRNQTEDTEVARFQAARQKHEDTCNKDEIIKCLQNDFIYRHEQTNKFRILSIDGGGIRGIIPAYWLCEIEKRAHKPIAHLFNMLAGTSTGGILAGGLSFPLNGKIDESTEVNPIVPSDYAPQYAAYQLLEQYTEKGSEIFPNELSLLKPFYFCKGLCFSRYSSGGRSRLFKKLLGEKSKISSSLTELVITAGREEFLLGTHLFNRYDAKYDAFLDDTYLDALMCTSAAPTYFPTHGIKHKGYFMDGGVHVNNPAGVAYAEAIRYGKDARNIRMISMGTGAFVPGTLDKGLSGYRKLLRENWNLKMRGLVYWGFHLGDVALEGESGNTDVLLSGALKGAEEDMYTGERLGSNYTRMQVWFEDAITLDKVDASNVANLTDIAIRYIEELDAGDDNYLNKLVEELLRDTE